MGILPAHTAWLPTAAAMPPAAFRAPARSDR
jgi:hypothetical protein